MISISNVSKIYKNNTITTIALDAINFKIKEGEFVAIMGPSGSGKSTLMHIIGALDIPTKGTYVLDDENISNLDENALAYIRNKKIGFVFQSYNLLPRTTAIKNVMLPMTYANIPKEKRVAKAKKLLTLVGLEDKMYNQSNQLSGGQQQRVAIARALSMDPKLLLADEPTGNIASSQAEEIMKIFQQLNRKGHTIIMITHEENIANYAHRIIILKDGKIISDKKNNYKT